ncbi:MAG: tetratricopeptide repeat protein [Saprospiraceae bacterium]
MILSRKYQIIFLLSMLMSFSLSASNLDSLENTLKIKIESENIKEQLDAYFELGKANLKHKETTKAYKYLILADSIADRNDEIKFKSKIQYQMGKCLIASHKYEEAITLLTKLIKNINSDGGKQLGDASYQLAKAYQVIGNNELAFEYHFKALQIREELQDQAGITYSYYKIGGIHFFQGNYHKAIEYYEKCLQLSVEINNKVMELSSYGAIGAAYSRMAQIDLSLKYNLKAYELSIASNRKSGLAYVTFNLGDNYQSRGDLNKALDYFNQSHKINIENDDRWGQIGSSKAIGEIYINKGEEKKGMRYLNESLDIAQSLGARPILVDVYKSMARSLENIGDYEEANKYYRNFTDLKDSLRNEATLQKMSDTKMQYEITKKEKDILKRDAELQSTYRNFLIVGLLALMVILWQVHSKYKTQTEHNKIQTDKNYQIQQQNMELEKAHLKQVETNQLLKEQNEQSLIQNKKLERKNDELQRFAYIASHDLKEPLRNIGSFATLLKRRFKGKLGSEADDYIDFITTNVSRMYDLLHEVLMYSKLENEEIYEEPVSLNEVVDTVIETLKGKIMEHNVDVKVANLPEVKGHKSHLNQLFQNLISNSIKYTNRENPQVEIGLKEKFQGNDLVYFVKDNGIGIDMEFKDRVFEIFKRLHGKDEYEGTGVGLAICKKIVNQNNGEIWVESEVGQGATFYFTLNIETDMTSMKMEAPLNVQGLGLEMN